MKRTHSWLALRLIVAASACAGHHASPETDEASIASLNAQMQVVGQDTTWVMRGPGYLLVGRTRADLGAVHASLERAASTFARIYPHDSLAPIVATVRRVSAPGKPYVAAAPVPSTAVGAIVELPVMDPKSAPRDARPMGMPGDAAAPAVRAWMSAHASRLTGTTGRLDQSRGESSDPRVPAWSVAVIEAAGDDAAIDQATKALAEHPEALIPLARYFTMETPTFGAPGEGRGRGQSGGESGPGGTRGGGGAGGGGMGGMGGGIGGGMGGMGGMGGRGGSGGRGGMGGGRGGGGVPGGNRGGSRGGEGQRMLTGPALFAAQSAVLSKYLGRVGYEVIGELTDAQIMGKPIDDVLTRHNLGTLAQADADWRMWLNARANSLQGE